MEILAEFAKNIKVYGGIRKLFAELEKISPEYAEQVEKTYIQAINETAMKEQ